MSVPAKSELDSDQSNTDLQRETVSVFTPIVRTFMLLVCFYYAINMMGHCLTETGWSRVLFASLSGLSSLTAFLFFLDLKKEQTLLKLEVAGIVGNGLLLVNLVLYYAAHFDPNRLVYFILLVFVFPMTGATRRVSTISSIVALALLYRVIIVHDQSYLQDYVFIGIAACFVAFGGTLMLRGVIQDALNSKLESAKRKADAMAAAEYATRLSVTDNLTNLPNRRDFFRTLKLRDSNDSAPGKVLAVLLIDLDDFKPVNDTYGHQVGDALLISVGKRLQDKLPDDAYLARIGGDEFAAIAFVSGPQEARIIGSELCDSMRAPFHLDRIVVHVGATIGVATKEDEGTRPENLVEYADYALYNAKRKFKGSCTIFTASDATDMTRKFFIDQALRKSDLEKELSVVYQPQFDMNTNQVSGFEALARWNSQELGQIDPATFIGVAESSGLITEVTQILLKKAMQKFQEWPETIKLSFNLSVHDVLDISSIDNILKITRAAGVDPSRICFEITETVMMGDVKKANLALQRLVEAGHEIALDDFGTGYSNFSYLQKLPINKIKIDRSFIRDVPQDQNSAKMISTLLQLSRSLNKDCVVEGIETEAEFAAMQSLGARTIQGFYCGRPMSAKDAEALIESERASEAADRNIA